MSRPLLRNTAVAVHHTATVDTPWDASAQERRLSSPMSLSTVKAMYAWYDNSATDSGHCPKSACSFPHHMVSADGTPGAANLPACRNGLARLSASDVPAAEQDAVRSHLRAHIDDAATQDRLRTARPTSRRDRTDWYRVVNHGGSADVMIYDEIGFFGVTATDLVNELAALDSQEINVRINSPGGDIFEGIAIYNALLSHPATVNITVDSFAASAASFIAMAGDTITMAPHSQMMIHDAHGLGVGTAADFRDLADMLDMQSDNVAAIFADRAGGTVGEWRAAMRAETWYSAAEAVDAGLADKVAAKPSRMPMPTENCWDLSVFAHAGRTMAPPPYMPQPARQPAASNTAVVPLDAESFRAAIAAARPIDPPTQPEPVPFADVFRAAFLEAK